MALQEGILSSCVQFNFKSAHRIRLHKRYGKVSFYDNIQAFRRNKSTKNCFKKRVDLIAVTWPLLFQVNARNNHQFTILLGGNHYPQMLVILAETLQGKGAVPLFTHTTFLQVNFTVGNDFSDLFKCNFPATHAAPDMPGQD